MAKNVLKAWLVDNTVITDDRKDRIFQLETTRSIGMEEGIAEALMNGESVNTGLFRGVAQFRGVAKNSVWDPKANSIHVSLTQEKALREAIKDTVVAYWANVL